MNSYWKSEDLDDKEFITYHEFDDRRFEHKKIIFEKTGVRWSSQTYYYGEDIYPYNEAISKEDLKEFKNGSLIVKQITKQEFYKLWDKIRAEYPGKKYED